MKPFGVRLAAGAITILLGALAAAQAQKDRQKDPDSTWTVADAAVLNTPPAPIAALGEASWGADSADFSATTKPGKEFPGGPLGSVQLVQHTEPADVPPAFSDPPPAFEASFAAMPTTGFSAPPNATAQNPGPSNPGPSNLGPPAASPDVAPPTGFGGFDPSQLPASLAAQPSPNNSPPASTAGWGMPAFGNEAPAVTEKAPAMSMGAATIDTPNMTIPTMGTPPLAPLGDDQSASAMPELSFDGPPGYDEEPHPAGHSHDDHDPEHSAPPRGFAGSNMLRDDAAPMSAPPPAATMAVSSPMTATPAAPPSFDSAPPPMQFAPQPGTAPSAPRIASLPALSRQANAEPASNPYLGSARDAQFEMSPNQTINSPGDRRLEGVQSPSVVIHKRAPSEVKVGKQAAFVIHVQNVGSAEALDVRVHDRVPAGMRLVDASPAPVVQGDSMLWQLGAMPVGDDRTITMQLIPEEEGELGSVARVTFEAAASVRTMSTRPQLNIVQRAPEKVLIGQQLEIELEVSNPGTGDAVGVILQADVPEGLEHPKGRQLDNLLGTLRAGEVRRQVLRLRAVAPGLIQNVVRLTSDEGLTAEHMTDVEVIAPELQVGLSGPSRRSLERQATYQLELSNIGTADATNVEIAAYLDRGFTFISTANEGQYDPSRHAVYWSLPQLPEGGHGQVPLTLLPVEEGERTIRLEARGDLGLTAKSEHNVTVESHAELTFQISDAADPIEIGSETTYEIRLSNRGSRGDSNVQVKFQLPAGLQLVSTDSDAGTDDRGLVAFAPQTQLDPGQEVIYRIRVKGVAPGTHLTRAIIVSDQSTVPVTKEESTMVYADR